MRITIPELSVIALVGVSGSGKSTFAASPLPARRGHLFRQTLPPTANGRRCTATHQVAPNGIASASTASPCHDAANAKQSRLPSDGLYFRGSKC